MIIVILIIILTGLSCTVSNANVEEITVRNYGDYIDYPVKIGLESGLGENEEEDIKTDWRILYKEDDYVYIILADYLPNNSNLLKLEKAGLASMPKTYGNYILFWRERPIKQTISEILLDTSYWDNLVNEKYAECAMGTPSLEMFCKSWNEKYTEEKIYFEILDDIKCYVGLTENPTKSCIKGKLMQEKDGYKNTLYYPHRSKVGNSWNFCYGYWLATASIYERERQMYIYCKGSITNTGRSMPVCGIRPVVKLKSNIELQYDNSKKVWIILN